MIRAIGMTPTEVANACRVDFKAVKYVHQRRRWANPFIAEKVGPLFDQFMISVCRQFSVIRSLAAKYGVNGATLIRYVDGEWVTTFERNSLWDCSARPDRAALSHLWFLFQFRELSSGDRTSIIDFDPLDFVERSERGQKYAGMTTSVIEEMKDPHVDAFRVRILWAMDRAENLKVKA